MTVTGTDAVRRSATVGEHQVSFIEAGSPTAPTVVLLHGLASDATTWDRAVEPLAEQGLHVLAVDLLGHGQSDKPDSTYLLDDFAAFLAQFLPTVGVSSATLIGHSFGGAIAVHFAHHYPQFAQRLVLVSAGGLGREVHPVLRAAALPGAERVLAAATAPPMWRIYRRPGLHRLLRLTPENLVNLRRAARSLRDTPSRTAFLASLRGVIEPGGQRGTFQELQYLNPSVPLLLVWTEGDPVIPVEHAYATRDYVEGSELVVFPGTGHEPHRRHARPFAEAVARFVEGRPAAAT